MNTIISSINIINMTWDSVGNLGQHVLLLNLVVIYP